MDFTRRCLFPFFIIVFLSAVTMLPSQESYSGEADGMEPAVVETGAVPEELLLDGRNAPRLHLYDGEETAVLSYGGSRSLVTMADNRVVHRMYDETYRLKSKRIWQETGASAPKATDGGEGNGVLLEPSQLVAQEDFYYHDSGAGYHRVVLTDFQGMRRTERFFSPEGLLTREEFYQFIPAEASTEQASEITVEAAAEPATDLPRDPWQRFPKLTLTKIIEYQYNGEEALTERLTTHLDGENAFTERIVYHQPGNIHGGYDTFEGDQLLVSRSYQDENHYTETRYIDNIRIESIYSGARLISETIYLDGKELRRTEY
ncbi:MAG: hypothetical protein IJC31_08200 [Spirochaetaceae bacterium]|nr:hypothetical protein [Spirochaetaceae bacterium]